MGLESYVSGFGSLDSKSRESLGSCVHTQLSFVLPAETAQSAHSAEKQRKFPRAREREREREREKERGTEGGKRGEGSRNKTLARSRLFCRFQKIFTLVSLWQEMSRTTLARWAFPFPKSCGCNALKLLLLTESLITGFGSGAFSLSLSLSSFFSTFSWSSSSVGEGFGLLQDRKQQAAMDYALWPVLGFWICWKEAGLVEICDLLQGSGLEWSICLLALGGAVLVEEVSLFSEMDISW